MAERIADLIERLQSRNEAERKAAASALVVAGPEAVAPLIKALCSGDWRARASAAWALGRIGDARAIVPLARAPDLLPAVDDAHDDLRAAAVEALAEIGGEAAVEFLIGAARCGSMRVRPLAVSALGRIGDVRAIPVLLDEARREGEDGLGAEEALGRMGDPLALSRKVVAAGHVSPEQRAAILERMGQSHRYPKLRRWHECCQSLLGDDEEQVREGAREILLRHSLLRPAVGGGGEGLLRPAEAGDDAALLRPANEPQEPPRGSPWWRRRRR